MMITITSDAPIYDKKIELKEFDESKVGVQGLMENGVTKVPRMFYYGECNILNPLSYPIFWPFCFLFTRHLISFYRVIFSNFYVFISRYFISFLAFYMYISQHFICTLCKHFTRLFSNFYPLKSHFFVYSFYGVSLLFSHFYSLL